MFSLDWCRAVTIIALITLILPLELAFAESDDDASEAPTTMLILDGSGSMWGQLDGVNKIVIARKAVRDLLDGRDLETPLGLMSYGHRRKGDCGDIETLVPVDRGTGPAITSAVEALNPKGKTPLSESLRQAAKILHSREERATVLLVTDGLETCNADPCAVAAELEASGVDFTVHVVGFDIAAEESANVACIAETTGGQFLAADNAEQLGTAMSTAVEAAEEGGRQSAVAVLSSEDDPIDDMVLRWTATPLGDNGTPAGPPVIDTERSRPLYLSNLKPGRYRVAATRNTASGHVDLKIDSEPQDSKRHPVSLDAGIVTVDAVLNSGGEEITRNLVWRIYSLGNSGKPRELIRQSSGADVRWILGPGHYEVEAELDAVRNSMEFSVSSGERSVRTLDLAAAHLTLRAAHAEGGPFTVGLVQWAIYPVTDGVADESPITKGADDDPESFTVAAGSYKIRTEIDGAVHWTPMTLAPGSDFEQTVVLGTARVIFMPQLAADGSPPERRIEWTVYPVGADGVAVSERTYRTSARGSRAIVLPAGTHEIAIDADGYADRKRIDIAAGPEQEIPIVLDAAEVRLVPLSAAGRALIEERLEWDFHPLDADGEAGKRILRRPGRGGIDALVPAGQYLLRVRGRDATYNAVIELVPGQAGEVEVALTME